MRQQTFVAEGFETVSQGDTTRVWGNKNNCDRTDPFGWPNPVSKAQAHCSRKKIIANGSIIGLISKHKT